MTTGATPLKYLDKALDTIRDLGAELDRIAKRTEELEEEWMLLAEDE